MSSKVTLDTSVIIEYVDRKGELHKQAELVMSAINSGKLTAIVPHVVLAEVFYVASRLYRELALKNPISRAEKLVKWLSYHPYIQIVSGLSLDLEAGKIKYNYRIALTDCYVLAASKIYNATALFKRRGKELLSLEGSLKREYKAIFLEDYK